MSENVKKKLSKGIKTLIIISCIFVFIISALLIYYFGHKLTDFDKMATKEFAIPGLSEGFVPQGLCYVDNYQKYLVSGYMSSGANSRIYVVDANTKQSDKYFTLSNTSVDKQKGHLGGLASHGDFVWISTEKAILTLNWNVIASVVNGDDVAVITEFDSSTEASFCYANDNELWVGEFYRKGSYETNTSHHYQISPNEINYAIALCYPINTVNVSGLANAPTKVLSLPNQVQGFSISNSGKIICSTSYSIPDSQILLYNNVFSTPATSTFNLNGTDLPLYVLSKNTLASTIIAPSMSEGLDYVNGELKILFESACNKYKFFTRNRVSDVMSINID